MTDRVIRTLMEDLPTFIVALSQHANWRTSPQGNKAESPDCTTSFSETYHNHRYLKSASSSSYFTIRKKYKVMTFFIPKKRWGRRKKQHTNIRLKTLPIHYYPKPSKHVQPCNCNRSQRISQIFIGCDLKRWKSIMSVMCLMITIYTAFYGMFYYSRRIDMLTRWTAAKDYFQRCQLQVCLVFSAQSCSKC